MKNQNGFGLIEVMIASAIMGTILLDAMQTMYISALQSSTNDTKTNLTTLVNQTSQLALNQTSCSLAVGTTQAYGTNLALTMPDGTRLANGSSLSAYALTVKSLTFANSSLVYTGADSTKVYYGTLNLVLQANHKVIGPNIFAPRSLGAVYLTVSPAGLVTSCGAALPSVASQPVPTPSPTPAATPAPDYAFISQCINNGGNYAQGSCTYKDQDGNCQ